MSWDRLPIADRHAALDEFSEQMVDIHFNPKTRFLLSPLQMLIDAKFRVLCELENIPAEKAAQIAEEFDLSKGSFTLEWTTPNPRRSTPGSSCPSSRRTPSRSCLSTTTSNCR